jgi:soluble lytic murein transglycosylase-like protein
MNLLRLFQQFIVALALIIPVQVAAGIYVYVDEKGVKHYTNTPTSRNYKLATLPKLNTPRSSKGYSSEGEYLGMSTASRDPHRYDKHIEMAADKHKIDPLLIKAIIKAESNFDQFATSSKGAQGLMQLMPETAQDLSVANPFNASQNINGGTRYFRKLLDTYGGDLTRSLAAYNAGPGRVAKEGPLPRIRETREYVRRVNQYYRTYKRSNSSGIASQIKPNKLVTVN